ncbi:MAG: acetyl-CoA hydrolase/transferase family protein [Bryobacterales bacterium]|nr:acetyl-CoA hydrolase/transferase family protein [Bryobacterales bacterium]
MSWLNEYQSKLTTADRAMEAVCSGDTVYIHPGSGTPNALVEALVRQAPRLSNVEIVHMLTLGNADYTRPEFEGIFRANALFIGANVRGAVNEGRADYTPIFLHEIESLFSTGAKELDVVLLQVSPPDRFGNMSLGVSVDCTLTAAKHGKFVIAQVNPRMPRAMGDSFLHVQDVHAIVEAEHELPELRFEKADPVQLRIAAHVASLIPNGATLQMGIGAVPDAVLDCLAHHRNLGLHTEMFSDGIIPLIESGVMNGARKSLHPGKLIAGFMLGTRKLFDFIDNNSLFEFHPIKYTNDPFIIARNDRMVAINSALQIDLTGQVCSDSIGTHPYSGFGGQVDFIRGAAHSRGGLPIIALPSTAKNGTISRIAPVLDPGAGVVTSRADVHYVITEHGIANLHGKTLRQRAEALIQIAEPKFRDQLHDFAVRARYLDPKPVLMK